MIKTIVFDLGGVLFSEGKSILAQKLPKEYNRDKILLLLKSPPSIELRKGLLTDKEFWGWAKRQLPPGQEVSLIKKEWYDSYTLDLKILELVKKLRGKYRLVAFSGNIRSRVLYLDRKYDFRKLFDAEVYSYDYHLTKADPEFMKVMIKESKAKPEEIIYIDDNQKTILPARKWGIKVLIYSSGNIGQLRKELQKLGVHL